MVRGAGSRKGKESDMYTFDSRVRYSETDEEGNLSVVGIMNYLQDCSTFQSEDLKLGISYLNEEKRAWWLSGWQIEILRQPHFGERICISTWPYGFKGIYGYRNFTIEDEMGNPLVRADSTWFYYDLEKGCPVRVPESQLEGYQIEDKPLAMPPAPKKIRLPETYETAALVTVERHHLDTNRHVNNAQYVAIARELLPVDFALGELRVEYRKAAVLGDVMYPKLAQVPEGYVVSLQDAEGQVYANLWLARTGL